MLACGDPVSGQDDTDTEGDATTTEGTTTAGPTTAGPTTAAPTTTTTTVGETTADTSSTRGPADESTGDTTGGTTEDSTGTDGTTGETYEGVLEIHRIGRYAPEPLADRFNEGAAEISAFDPVSQSLLVTNGMTGAIDVLDLSDPTMPTLVQSILITDPSLDGPTSVAIHDGVVAAAVPSATSTDPGRVIFFDIDGTELSAVTVGVLPDMVAWSPDGNTVITANEGEPTGYGPGETDPEGSVSLIDVSAGPQNATQLDVSTAGFGGLMPGDLDATTRIFGPGSTIAQDLEPEYVAVSANSATAWVTLQENNALAIVDLATATVTDVVGLGLVDHSLTGLDPSNQDDAIAIATHPVWGMRQPDAIASFVVGGSTYLVTANEGDARDYDGLDEEARISSQTLDPVVFPNAAMLQDDAMLGRLNISTVSSDPDGDGDLDQLWAFGSRSISIFDPGGNLLWDSGDAIEQAAAAAFPMDFNATHDANESFDSRSDDKGPEPEGLAVGWAHGTTYVFVGLERIGGFMVWDVGDPLAPVEWGYVNPRDFTGDPELGTADDLAPEGMLFVSGGDSPTGNPLLIVTHEVSGTVSIYELVLVPLPE
ncbi:choice-of-anchor I family protein [Paraliomyxa miuraensis]|uniref:choice-of-anchor I family protein n=1 Tax=Paraliomyxa miuraensis TaxID=376150 RepID=UPI00224F70FD|nr:choice-of-anchor I family protein [Paraliomyxa miuraensis]MCX4239546.1 choice-of-anchor I family protein [Paraliomyxa miuraensis]